MNMLEAILRQRRVDVAETRKKVSLRTLEKWAARRVHHSLSERLIQTKGLGIIAEVKKASPSAGLLRPRYCPARVARGYEKAGAAGISVLTEPHHFLGCGTHLRAVRRAVAIPVLRKDFLCDAYQIVEAAAWGADVVLLIVAALSKKRLRELYRVAREHGLEVIVEIHEKGELKAALELSEALLGVNSRDLRTLKTDLTVFQKLAQWIPNDRIALAESGIRSQSDIRMLLELGYRGCLVGEILLRCPDPAATLRAFVSSINRVPHRERLHA